MRRKLIIRGAVAALLAGILVLLWTFLGRPPPRLIVKHGFPPAGGPTGRAAVIEGIEFVEIGPGYFRMGSHHRCEKGDSLGRICAPIGLPFGKRPRHDGDECPPHWVELRRPFWLARTEVTNEQYERFEPGHDRDPVARDALHPAVNLSWEKAKEFCSWLSSGHGLTLRLPSEAEWEFACGAAGAEKPLPEDSKGTAQVRGAAIVASSDPDSWGFFDLRKNVWEWCEDIYHPSYVGAPTDGSPWTTDSEATVIRVGTFEADLPGSAFRVARGEFWSSSGDRLRSARGSFLGAAGQPHVGLRPAFAATPEQEHLIEPFLTR